MPSLKEIVAQVEKQVLKHVLKKYNSSRKAGKVLGVSNTTILNKMHAYGLSNSNWDK
jgi:transcriptional regulator of aroF, aroG, tyrA and aromatic amino acid transport